MIQMLMKKILIAAGLLIPIFAFVAVPNAAAQTTSAETRESITMSPSSSKFKIDAGTSAKGKLTVVNDGVVAYDFLVYARPYSIVDNNYENPNFTKVTKYSDLYGWVQFSKTRYHIEAGATLEVEYTVNVPSGAAPGGHYGVIFAETQPVDNPGEGSSVIRKKRVGSIVYATVNGSYRNEGQALESNLDFWQVQPPLRATVTAKNTGNTDFATTTRLTVRDVFGNKKYEATKDYQVLPDTTRTVPLEWTNSSWFGFYKVETSQKFLDQSVSSEGYVLMMPRFMPIALVVIIIIGILYYARTRRKKQ